MFMWGGCGAFHLTHVSVVDSCVFVAVTAIVYSDMPRDLLSGRGSKRSLVSIFSCRKDVSAPKLKNSDCERLGYRKLQFSIEGECNFIDSH